jgi:hydroxymethylpyrimidine/phosphomethylpyrimidine kinase
MRPVVLSIAGSDPSAGAGIQADLKTIEANGGYAATVVTAVTAQNTRGVRVARALEPGLLSAQLDAVFDDLPVRAVKSGMLSGEEQIRVIAAALRRFVPAHYVCDPVMLSGSGFTLLQPEALAALKRELLPLCTLVTPNAPEAEALTGRTVRSPDDAEAAGAALLECGAAAVLVSGGHLPERRATDVLVTGQGVTVFEGQAVDAPHDHGTGCVLASAVATHLALGRPLVDAIRAGKRFVTEALKHGLPLGKGRGPTDPLFRLHSAAEEAGEDRR